MRGLAWMLGFAAAGAESARTLAALAQATLRRLPGLGPRAPRVANAAVYALSRMPGTAALAQLGRLATRVTYRGTLAQVDKALEARAAEQGVPRDRRVHRQLLTVVTSASRFHRFRIYVLIDIKPPSVAAADPSPRAGDRGRAADQARIGAARSNRG